jgi:paraquat-inducible protein B
MNNDAPRDTPRRTVSEVHKSWWPGWIWGVPLAAIAIVVWLVVRAVSSRGITVTVSFDDANGLKAGDTKILYRGLEIGEVHSLDLSTNGQEVIAHVDINRTAEGLLHSGTRFYLQGAEPSFSDPSSLKALLAGASIVLVPGPGAQSRHFAGIIGKPPENFKVKLPYLVMFDGDVGDLKPGAPVKLRGFTVGEVTSVSLAVGAGGALSTPVILSLDPTRFHIQSAEPMTVSWRNVLNGTLEELIRDGLRARLDQTPPLIGAQQVILALEPRVASATLRMEGPLPEIPAVPAGGLQRLLTQAGEIPLGEISRNVRDVTAHLDQLISSKELHDSILKLDSTLSELDSTIHAVGPRLPPTIDSIHATVDALRGAATQIDSTAAVAKRTLGARGTEQGGNLQDALRELTEAARAARSLADELDERPESIIRGAAKP